MVETRRAVVLLVESHAAISMTLEDDLSEAGYEVTSIGTCTSSLEWLEANTPDLAILGSILHDPSCLELARALQQRGVPFMVFSGSRHCEFSSSEFEEVPWVEKPATVETILEVLARLARDAQDTGQRAAGLD
jgi:DNA-binding response OmpR family regulator